MPSLPMSSLVPILITIFKRASSSSISSESKSAWLPTPHVTKTVLCSVNTIPPQFCVRLCYVVELHGCTVIQLLIYTCSHTPFPKKSLPSGLPDHIILFFSLLSFILLHFFNTSSFLLSLSFLFVRESLIFFLVGLNQISLASALPRAGIKGKQHYAWLPLFSFNCFGFYFLSIMVLLWCGTNCLLFSHPPL